MSKIEVLNARSVHKSFILYANNRINDVNSTKKESNLSKNIDKDLFGENPICKCLIATIEQKPVGMILYSHTYWADDRKSSMGLSNVYRRKISKIRCVFSFNKETKTRKYRL